MDNKEVIAKSYTLRTRNGDWLGQVVLTSDGAFMSITDYGNFSYAWRCTSYEDFRQFILRLDIDYFAKKMFSSVSDMANYNAKEIAKQFAEKILPPLKVILQVEIFSEKPYPKETQKALIETETPSKG